MKKINSILIVLFVFFITQSAYSLPDFIYRDIALDPEGEIIASDDWENDLYVELRLSLYEGDDMVFQQYYNNAYVDEFGYFVEWFGYYYDQQESLWVDISEIRATAELHIKIEIYDEDEGWYTVAFKQLTEAMRNQGGGQWGGTIINTEANGDIPGNIEGARRVSKDGGTVNRGNYETVRAINKQGFMESAEAIFDASQGNVFVYTGGEAVLNVSKQKPGQTIYVSKSAGEGALNFGGVAISTGETYLFLYNGKNWSRVK